MDGGEIIYDITIFNIAIITIVTGDVLKCTLHKTANGDVIYSE